MYWFIWEKLCCLVATDQPKLKCRHLKTHRARRLSPDRWTFLLCITNKLDFYCSSSKELASMFTLCSHTCKKIKQKTRWWVFVWEDGAVLLFLPTSRAHSPSCIVSLLVDSQKGDKSDTKRATNKHWARFPLLLRHSAIIVLHSRHSCIVSLSTGGRWENRGRQSWNCCVLRMNLHFVFCFFS